MTVIRVTMDVEVSDPSHRVEPSLVGRGLLDRVRQQDAEASVALVDSHVVEQEGTIWVPSNSADRGDERTRLVRWLADPGRRDVWTKQDLIEAIERGDPWARR